jgi:predicted phage baseplate assembly protein
MPLQAPNLDNRLFEDLLTEAKLRIPRYNRGWTDFNESDPGITLVQLFAWFTELMLAQFNQIPDVNYIKFLQLMGLELRPAQPATAHLTFYPTPGAVVDPVPQYTQVVAQPANGGDPLIFETAAGVDVIRIPLTDLQVFDGSAPADVTPANVPGAPDFSPFGITGQPGSALYLGFTPPDPPATGRLFPQEIRLLVFLPEQSQPAQPQDADEVKVPLSSPVTLTWEYHPAADPARWEPLNVYNDDSLAFTRQGYIQLEGPSDIVPSQELQVTDQRYWLRARLADGNYPAGHVPLVDFIRFNTVPALNLATIVDEELGPSDGTPNQIFQLFKQPVLPDSLVLNVESATTDPQTWQRRDDFFASTNADQHYTLNPNTGVITFGDGTRGMIPVAGALIVAARYRFGGGAAGNVGPGGINGLPGSVQGLASVTNERAAAGGREEQSVDELKTLAPHQLRTRQRAVTADDFTALASQAGQVAKATAIPRMHPDFPGADVPGTVTVIIVPDNTDLAPAPTVDQCRAVAAYLNNYRLLTTELLVKGPAYTTIAVAATVAAQPYVSFDEVSQNVIAALNFYLDPLARIPTKPKLSETTLAVAGKDQWNFGDTLHPTNLFSIILSVSGVAFVKNLAITVDDKPVSDLSATITLPADGLFASGKHQITVVPA